MVLISIDPFSFKKTFLLVVALLGLSSALCFADPLFISSQYGLSGRRSHRVIAVAASVTPQSAAESSTLAQGADLGFGTACDPE
jgi:hypothetical protein